MAIRGHMLSLSDALIQVPLIVRHQDIGFGREADAQAGTINMFHTILSHCGVDALEYSNGRTGRDILDPGFLAEGDVHVFAEQERWTNPAMALVPANTGKACVRTTAYKYVEIEGGCSGLYDLRNDPRETASAAEDMGVEAAALSQVLADWRRSLSSSRESSDGQEPMAVDAMIASRLKDLGYM